MKCVVCNSSRVEIKGVDEEIKAGADIVLLKLDTLVCLDCGERYYTRSSMQVIENVRLKLQRHELDTEVVGKVRRAKAA